MVDLPFAAEIEQLAAASREQAERGPPSPIATPLVLDSDGYIWMPSPDGASETQGVYLHAGLRLGWIPVPDHDGLVLSLWGGQGGDPDFVEDSVTAFVTCDGFRRLLADLQAIAAQFDEKST